MDIVPQTLQSLIEDARISKIAAQIYVLIARSESFNENGLVTYSATVVAICQKLKRTRSAVYVAMRQLERAGYLVWFKVGNKNRYILRSGTPPKRGK